MRPRVFPAEDQRNDRVAANDGHCFNEAAGIPRGRLTIDEARQNMDDGLQ